MQQRIEAIVDDTQKFHDSRAFGLGPQRDAPEGPLIIITVSERN
jgi:hypothetical protein